MFYEDLHSHTNFSLDSDAPPMALAEAAFSAGINMLAITDHWHFAATRKDEYFSVIPEVKKAYKDKIKILFAAEIDTITYLNHRDFLPDDISAFDFTLLEHVGHNLGGFTVDEMVAYRQKVGTETPMSLAHTDIFTVSKQYGLSPEKMLEIMVKNNIMWELNVNLDRIHGGKPHDYVERFWTSEEEQKIVKESGVIITVGFDSHVLADYNPSRCIDACKKLDELGLPIYKG